MSAELLLSRLSRVRKSGPVSWRAGCPCEHQRPDGELSITVADDGRILLHAFCGHSAAEVLGAIGLELADLYPERTRDVSPEGLARARAEFRRSAWSAALNVLGRESTCVLVAAGTLAHNEPLTADDHDRLALAMQRIDDARQVLS